MKVLATLITFLMITSLAEARTLPPSVISNPNLMKVAQSLELRESDWPVVSDKTIRTCLKSQIRFDRNNPGLDLADRVSSFEDCCETWTTMEIKARTPDKN